MRGRFITFEGGEGSGKSTQMRHLETLLKARGIPVLVTREPGGSPTGEKIRNLLLDPAIRMDAITQLFLFSAARHDHVQQLIEPALKNGTWVICDRFADSSRAYQGAAGDVSAALVQSVEEAAVGTTRPDLTLVLDLAPQEGLARANKRRNATVDADAFEAADMSFHERVRAGFLAIAAKEPKRCAVVDASGSEATIAQAISALVEKRLMHEMRD
ncbi:MAG: dTMP kinase [Beijerinckiaceae bacterium]